MLRTAARRVATAAAVACSVAFAAVPDAAAEDDWSVRWNNGFRVDSKDKKFSFKFGGRIRTADPGRLERFFRWRPATFCSTTF